MPSVATATLGIGASNFVAAPVSASQDLDAMADMPSSWADIVAVEEQQEWASHATIPVDLRPEQQDMDIINAVRLARPEQADQVMVGSPGFSGWSSCTSPSRLYAAPPLRPAVAYPESSAGKNPAGVSPRVQCQRSPGHHYSSGGAAERTSPGSMIASVKPAMDSGSSIVVHGRCSYLFTGDKDQSTGGCSGCEGPLTTSFQRPDGCRPSHCSVPNVADSQTPGLPC